MKLFASKNSAKTHKVRYVMMLCEDYRGGILPFPLIPLNRLSSVKLCRSSLKKGY